MKNHYLVYKLITQIVKILDVMWKRWINTNTEDSIIKRVLGELTKTMDLRKKNRKHTKFKI